MSKTQGEMVDHVLQEVMLKENLLENELEWYGFQQAWGNTTIGFGGIGGQAITASTMLVVIGKIAYVYSNGGLLYTVNHPKSKFFEDLRRFHMAARSMKGKYDNEND